METEQKSGIVSVFAYELIGTSLIMYAQMLNVGELKTTVNAMYLIALVLAWNISGGHFNPAISIGMFIA